MGLQNHALYEVAVKALVFDGHKLLVLRTPDGYIDFPGGRVDEMERDLSWQIALTREIVEELGGGINIDVGQTLFVSKRQYRHHGTHYVAAIFFRCTYQDGEITLSDEHGSFAWLTPAELFTIEDKFISEDEKIQLQAYLDS